MKWTALLVFILLASDTQNLASFSFQPFCLVSLPFSHLEIWNHGLSKYQSTVQTRA